MTLDGSYGVVATHIESGCLVSYEGISDVRETSTVTWQLAWPMYWPI